MDQQIQQVIYDAIEIVVNKKNSQLQFDRTIDCIIEEVVNLSTGEYKVRYLDESFSAFDTYGENYRVGKIVQVLIPQNNMALRKTILGLKDSNETTSDVILEQEKVVAVGIPFEQIYAKCDIPPITATGIYGAYKGIQYTLFENTLNEDIIIDEKNNYNAHFRTYAKDKNMFMVTAEFNTRWLINTVIAGNYGLEIIFESLNGEELPYYIQKSDLIGEPLRYTKSYIPITLLFPIDGNKLNKLKSIKLFSEGFIREDNSGNKLDGIETDKELKEKWLNGQSEIFLRNLSISFAQTIQTAGYYLNLKALRGYYQDLVSGNLQLKAEIKYNGQVVEDTSSIKYYWFKRNIQIRLNSENYNELGGIGWELIEDENEPIYEFKIPAETLSREYKCVVICSGIKLFDTITMYQSYSSKTIGELILSSKGNGSATLTAVVHGLPNNNITYHWSRETINSGQIELSENSNVLQITTSQIVGYDIYRCLIKYNGIDAITLEKKVYNTVESKDYDVIFTVSNGGVYTYDTAGDLYPPQVYEKPITSHSIDFSIPQNIGNYSYKWIFPENSLITFKNGLLEGDILTSNKTQVEFEIDTRYDYTKASNNRIELQITTDSEPKNFYYDVNFIKEGDPGTNGTSLMMKIDYAENSPFTLVSNGSIQLKVDLWYNGSPTFDTGLVNDYFTLSADIPKDYREKNCLYEGINIGIKNNLITITANDNFKINHGTIDQDDFYFNSIIQIKMTPNSNQDNFKYSVSGIYGIPVSTYSEMAKLLAKGTRTVVYQSDGYNPSYSKIPMYLEGWKGTIAAGSTGGELKKQYNGNGNIIITDIFEPVEYFNHKNTYAAYHFIKDEHHYFLPIVFIINTFSKGLLNSWDGASVQIDENGGSILAPQIGAGKKDDDNLFTGVLMGQYVGDDTSLSNKHGLYGFSSGVATFAFKDDGTAFIGAPSGGRIEFNGEKGIIQSYGYDSETQSGMSIDLSNGYIDSYNFKLTSSALEINNNKFDFNIGQIDTDNNRIGSFTIRDGKKDLFKISNNNYYLQSLDFKESESGLKLDLYNGKMYSKYFTINADGSVSAAGGNFKIDTLGNVSISGNINMTGGSISWANLTSGNLKDDIESAVEDAGKALDAAAAIANGTYAGGSFINNDTIYSPNIYTQQFTINPKDKVDSYNDTFIIKGRFDGEIYTMFKIGYGTDIAPYTTIENPSDAPIKMNAEFHCQGSTKFTSSVDFRSATEVLGLDQWVTGGSGGTATAVFG